MMIATMRNWPNKKKSFPVIRKWIISKINRKKLNGLQKRKQHFFLLSLNLFVSDIPVVSFINSQTAILIAVYFIFLWSLFFTQVFFVCFLFYYFNQQVFILCNPFWLSNVLPQFVFRKLVTCLDNAFHRVPTWGLHGTCDACYERWQRKRPHKLEIWTSTEINDNAEDT